MFLGFCYNQQCCNYYPRTSFHKYVKYISRINFFGGGAMSAACGNFQNRDQTHAIAATQATAVTIQDS